MKTELSEGAILVRPYRFDDIEALFEAVRESVAEVSPWLPWCHPDYSIAETREFVLSRDEAWKNETEYTFAVFDTRDGRYLGGVGLNQINRVHQVANLGYWVRTSATKRKVATTAARLAAGFGFDLLGLRRIEILAAVDNIASQRVAEGIGATREGVLRGRLLIHGASRDAVVFSLVEKDMAGKL